MAACVYLLVLLFIGCSSSFSDADRQLLEPGHVYEGEYECHKYDSEGKNNWHYVTIARVSDGKYSWTNRAGVTWSLYTSNAPVGSLRVGKDCPYYDKGFTTAEFKFNDQGHITRVLGPWKEPYDRLGFVQYSVLVFTASHLNESTATPAHSDAVEAALSTITGVPTYNVAVYNVRNANEPPAPLPWNSPRSRRKSPPAVPQQPSQPGAPSPAPSPVGTAAPPGVGFDVYLLASGTVPASHIISAISTASATATTTGTAQQQAAPSRLQRLLQGQPAFATLSIQSLSVDKLSSETPFPSSAGGAAGLSTPVIVLLVVVGAALSCCAQAKLRAPPRPSSRSDQIPSAMRIALEQRRLSSRRLEESEEVEGGGAAHDVASPAAEKQLPVAQAQHHHDPPPSRNSTNTAALDPPSYGNEV